MRLITEITENVNIINEEADGKTVTMIEGIFLQGNVKNRNGRIYTTEVLDKEVKRYTDNYINKNRALGELGHPKGPTINLERVSHVITELKREGNNYVGKARLTDTPYGNIAKNLIESGVRLGVSSRGMGSLEQRDGANYVKDDFMLATAADIVADPSAPDAFVNGIMEGVEWIWDNGVLKAQELEKAKAEVNESASKKELDEDKLLEIFEKVLLSCR